MSDLFNYDSMEEGGEGAAENTGETPQNTGESNDQVGSDTQSEGAGDTSQDSAETPPAQGSEGSGEEGAQEGEKEVETPKWLYQASKDYQSDPDLQDKAKIDDLIADYKRLKGEAAKTEAPPEQYELGESEQVSEQFDSFFRNTAKELGLSQEQAKQFFDKYGEFAAKETSRLSEKRRQQRKDAEEKLRKDFPGAEYNEMIQGVKTSLMGLAPEGLVETLREKELDNDPLVVQWLANVGRSLGEDKLVGMGAGRATNQNAEVSTFEYGKDFNEMSSG